MRYSIIKTLPYPENILSLMGIENPNQDQIRGYEYVLSTLNEKTREYITCRFGNQLTLQECASEYSVSRQNVDDTIKRAFRRMKSEKNWPYIEMGLEGYPKFLKEDAEKNEAARLYQKREKGRKRINRRLEGYEGHTLKMALKKDIRENGYYLQTKPVSKKKDEILLKSIESEMSNRVINCFRRTYRERYYEMTLSDILDMVIANPRWFGIYSNFGKTSIIQMYDILFKYEYLTKTEYGYLKSLV